jgi:hypothetical protein
MHKREWTSKETAQYPKGLKKFQPNLSAQAQKFRIFEKKTLSGCVVRVLYLLPCLNSKNLTYSNGEKQVLFLLHNYQMEF